MTTTPTKAFVDVFDEHTFRLTREANEVHFRILKPYGALVVKVDATGTVRFETQDGQGSVVHSTVVHAGDFIEGFGEGG